MAVMTRFYLWNSHILRVSFVVKMYIPDHPADIGSPCSDAVMFSSQYALCTIQQSLWLFMLIHNSDTLIAQ